MKYHPTDEQDGPEFNVDYTPPFRRVSMIRELEKKLKVSFPHPSEFDTEGEGGIVYWYLLLKSRLPVACCCRIHEVCGPPLCDPQC